MKNSTIQKEDCCKKNNDLCTGSQRPSYHTSTALVKGKMKRNGEKGEELLSGRDTETGHVKVRDDKQKGQNEIRVCEKRI